MGDKLTTQEVAQELGYTLRHVQRLLRLGTIRGEQFNRVWIIDRSEVERVKALQSKGGRFYPNREEEDTEEDLSSLSG